MGNDGSGLRRLSVARELVILAANLEALRLVAQQKLNGASHADKAHELATVLAGGLHVLRDRLHLLERIVLRRVNPALVISPENEARSEEEGPGIIREWSEDEEERRLAAEWGAFYRRKCRIAEPDPHGSN